MTLQYQYMRLSNRNAASKRLCSTKDISWKTCDHFHGWLLLDKIMLTLPPLFWSSFRKLHGTFWWFEFYSLEYDWLRIHQKSTLCPSCDGGSLMYVVLAFRIFFLDSWVKFVFYVSVWCLWLSEIYLQPSQEEKQHICI